MNKWIIITFSALCLFPSVSGMDKKVEAPKQLINNYMPEEKEIIEDKTPKTSPAKCPNAPYLKRVQENPNLMKTLVESYKEQDGK